MSNKNFMSHTQELLDLVKWVVEVDFYEDGTQMSIEEAISHVRDMLSQPMPNTMEVF